VLANVELALTISGITRAERRSRAKKALEQVGLGNQLHKKPNQMSGGQMQRVAIARALVNNPDILLADEPTGALDTETSVQVMELLKEVAKDRLVIMVTHNPELAAEYATRIVRLRDGKITDDTNPLAADEAGQVAPVHRNMGRASMSFLTALSLSFNNLLTKKARTLLTAFAGSIGIIGIAMILSLSNGVNNYIADIQKTTMTSYPISIEAQSIDLSGMLASGRESRDSAAEHGLDAVYSDVSSLKMASGMAMSVTTNNLTAFKQYLDDPDSAIHQYVGENGIVYSYDTQFSVYTRDPEGVLVNTDGSTLSEGKTGSSAMMSGMMGMSSGASGSFEELLPGTDGALISSAITDNYDVVYGTLPSAYNEVVLVLDSNNEISASTLYQLGILPVSEYRDIMRRIESGEEVALEAARLDYEDICSRVFWLIPACDFYTENANGYFDCVTDAETLLGQATELRITGVIRPKADADMTILSKSIGYTCALTEYLIEHTNNSPVVKAQLAAPDINILNGASFAPADDAAKVADAKAYLGNLTIREKAEMCREILLSVYGDNPEAAQMMQDMTDAKLAAMLDEYILSSEDAADERLMMIYSTYISSGSYDENMSAFGFVSKAAPSGISIYADSFEDKEAITDCIADYNRTASEANQISYTDYVGLLMSSVTTIVDVISYVLIAFVAVSLVVSSIMIGIITYISVLERTREIGVLRAIGASKRNISQVFNAETFITGLLSGVIGVGCTLLMLIPGNAIIHAGTGSVNVNAALPAVSALILIALSVILTLIGGLIPAKKAAKKDPVAALRSE